MRRKLPVTLVTAVLTLASIGAVCAVLLYRQSVRSTATSNTFTLEAKQRAKFPLYFPSDLPGSLKIDTDSLQFPAEDRIFYVITDDEGHKINVTLQKAVEGVNPVDKFDKQSELRTVKTQLGDASVFIPSDGILAGVITANETWIFVNTVSTTFKESQFDTILTSFHSS